MLSTDFRKSLFCGVSSSSSLWERRTIGSEGDVRLVVRGGLDVLVTVEPFKTGILELGLVVTAILDAEDVGLTEALLRLLTDDVGLGVVLFDCLGMAEPKEVGLFAPLFRVREASKSAVSTCCARDLFPTAAVLGDLGTWSTFEMALEEPSLAVLAGDVPLLMAKPAPRDAASFCGSSSSLSSSSLSDSDVEVKSAGARPPLPPLDSDLVRGAADALGSWTAEGAGSPVLLSNPALLASSLEGIL